MRPFVLLLITAAMLLPLPIAADEDVTPRAATAANTLTIVGPEGSVEPGEDAYLKISGLTLDEIKAAKSDGLFDLTVFPLVGVRVHATYDWLNDSLELMFRAESAGEYLCKLHLVREGKLEIAGIVVAVEGDSPNPQPGPDPAPGPLPQGTRLALILWESRQVTVQQATVKETLRRHLLPSPNIQFRTLDPDQPSENNWADPIKAEVAKRGIALPVLVACVLPSDTPDSPYFAGVEALPVTGEAAIKLVEEALNHE